MRNITNITPPRVPLTDPRTGLISREWYMFFLNLFNLTGAGGDNLSIEDLAQAPSVEAAVAQYDEAIKLLMSQVDTQPDIGGGLGTLASVNQDNVGYLGFNTAPSPAPSTTKVGNVYWDGGTTLNINMTPNVVQPVGESQYFYIKATSAIAKGQVVMSTGTVGASGQLTGAPATGLTDGQYLMGVAAEDITLNSFGMVTSFGLIRGVDTVTPGWVEGDILYYNPATPGGLTKTVPSAPDVKAVIAAVVYVPPSGTNGSIFVRTTFGSALGQTDSNVQFSALANGNMIQYDSALKYWKNVTVAAALTNNTSFVANGIVYANSTSTLATGTDITYDGAYFKIATGNNFGIGSTSAAVNMYNTEPITGGTIAYGQFIQATIQPDVTSSGIGLRYQLATAANGGTPYTISNITYNYVTQSTFNADSTVTNQQGYFVDATMTGATNNYGFRGSLAAATGVWNLYMGGTAKNALAGFLRVGSVTAPTVELDVTGDAKISSTLTVTGATTLSSTLAANGNITIGNAINVILNTSTGTKIGTATNQKLGFFNATPIVQYATTGTTTGFTLVGPDAATTRVQSNSTFTGNTGTTAYTVGDIVRALKLLGLIAA